jgi:hypothetical protein
MARPVEVAGRKYLGKPRLSIRYDITTRTVDRWVKAKVLPPPDLVVNNRPYWDEERLDRHDRRMVAEHAAAGKQSPSPS